MESKVLASEWVNELTQQFEEQLGGVDNFTRKTIFRVLYRNLNITLEVALPFYKKYIGDIWFAINRRINQVSNK